MNTNISVYDYSNHKLCDLYDEEVNLTGQAFDIQYIENWDGVNELSFSIPYMIDHTKNKRWEYLKSEYLIRMHYRDRDEWFVASKPEKKKQSKKIIGAVSCKGTPILLKTKNIYLEFDDENGIGTVDYLMEQILAGTGWSLGYCEVLYEQDGVTEKVRSLSSKNKTGALGLINDVCNLFLCRPIYHTDTQTVDILALTNREEVFEAEVGKNIDALSANYNSDDIITRLYVEGEYGDDGYVGIDDVNPTGLSYLFDFDYYREIGVFSDEHEAAYQQYVADITAITAQIKANMRQIIEEENYINNLIGQCKLVVYYTSQGFTTPVYVYGELTNAQKNLAAGDDVVVLNTNHTHRYVTIETTPEALIESGDFCIAKFVTKAAGSIGAKEVQIEAKEKTIDSLNRKIAATIKEDKKAEYRAEIAVLQQEIQSIYQGDDSNNGLYAQMYSLMNTNGEFARRSALYNTRAVLLAEQDDIEATFVAAMGNLLRSGCWQNNNYIVGQEEHLLADAEERMRIMSRPKATYSFDYVRLVEEYGVPIEDIKINAIIRTNDDELDVHENLFIHEIKTGIDHKNIGDIEVSNEDISINGSNLGSLLSRISQLSDLIDQKNTIYDRAAAISKSGSFFADRLNGQIDVVKNQILSSVSNWYTDESGNMIFVSADGGSAMMLSGAGFMLASDKTEDGEWNWRLTGTGKGLNADEITAGFISADRIESGSISTNKVTPNFGSTLSLSGNPALESLSDQIAPAFDPAEDYQEGDLVNYRGDIYIFTSDHPAGAWDPSDVSRTDVTTQLELMPDKIIQYVGQQGYSRTFIQLTDPTLDTDKNVVVGDYWIMADPNIGIAPWLWSYVQDYIWHEMLNMTWGTVGGYTRVFCYAGDEKGWMLVYDTSGVAVAYTRIEQNKESIEIEAYRANAAEGELRNSIMITASTLRAEVSHNYTSKAFFQMTADGKIQLSSANFSSLGNSASGIYITPQSIDINSGGSLSVQSGGSLSVQSGGDMNINSGGSLTIQSNGNFSLTSQYFSVTDTGVITATSGTIGGFTIGNNTLSAGSGTSYIQMATSGWAFAAGSSTVDSAPFRVNANGDVYIKSLKVKNSSNVWDTIDFTSFATQEDVAGGFEKLKYNTVTSINVSNNTITLSNGKSYTLS